MIKGLRVLLAVLAVYRLASLIATEEGPSLGVVPGGMGLFDWLRMKLGAYDHGSNGLADTNLGRGISCPLCVGFYVAGAVAFLVAFPSKVGDFLLTWLGISGAQVWLETMED